MNESVKIKLIVKSIQACLVESIKAEVGVIFAESTFIRKKKIQKQTTPL